MDKRKISISFSKEHEDLYEYIKDTPNRSRFICEAIRDKINGDKPSNNFDESIEKALIKALSSYSLPSVYNQQREDLSEEYKDLISSLF